MKDTALIGILAKECERYMEKLKDEVLRNSERMVTYVGTDDIKVKTLVYANDQIFQHLAKLKHYIDEARPYMGS